MLIRSMRTAKGINIRVRTGSPAAMATKKSASAPMKTAPNADKIIGATGARQTLDVGVTNRSVGVIAANPLARRNTAVSDKRKAAAKPIVISETAWRRPGRGRSPTLAHHLLVQNNLDRLGTERFPRLCLEAHQLAIRRTNRGSAWSRTRAFARVALNGNSGPKAAVVATPEA